MKRVANAEGTVLVGFAGAMSAPEVIWSLVDEGFQVVAFERRGKRTALHHSRNVVCYEITPPELDFQAALSDLHALQVCLDMNSGNNQRLLFPLDDTALYLCSRVQLEPEWTLVGPQAGNVELALDKNLQLQAAANAGFNVPRAVLAGTTSEILQAGLRFPIIMKPAKAVSYRDDKYCGCRKWICLDRKELDRALTEWAERVPVLVQPFILGTGEGVFGLATKEGVQGWSAHRRLRMMNPQGSGSSACIAQAVPHEITLPIERFVRDTGWRGLFMIELLRDNSGKLWFMELNGRPWGSMALARRQGLEYPAWAVRYAIDTQYRPPVREPRTAEITGRNLGRELMHLAFVLRGPRSKALREWPSPLKALSDVMRIGRKDCFYNLRNDDLKVFISDCLYTIRDQIFKSRI